MDPYVAAFVVWGASCLAVLAFGARSDGALRVLGVCAVTMVFELLAAWVVVIVYLALESESGGRAGVGADVVTGIGMVSAVAGSTAVLVVAHRRRRQERPRSSMRWAWSGLLVAPLTTVVTLLGRSLV